MDSYYDSTMEVNDCSPIVDLTSCYPYLEKYNDVGSDNWYILKNCSDMNVKIIDPCKCPSWFVPLP